MLRNGSCHSSLSESTKELKKIVKNNRWQKYPKDTDKYEFIDFFSKSLKSFYLVIYSRRYIDKVFTQFCI